MSDTKDLILELAEQRAKLERQIETLNRRIDHELERLAEQRRAK